MSRDKPLQGKRIVITRAPEQAQEFKRRLAEGPRSAQVKGIEESEEAVNNSYASFVIEGGW